jgi:hypothetical protein
MLFGHLGQCSSAADGLHTVETDLVFVVGVDDQNRVVDGFDPELVLPFLQEVVCEEVLVDQGVETMCDVLFEDLNFPRLLEVDPADVSLEVVRGGFRQFAEFRTLRGAECRRTPKVIRGWTLLRGSK